MTFRLDIHMRHSGLTLMNGQEIFKGGLPLFLHNFNFCKGPHVNLISTCVRVSKVVSKPTNVLCQLIDCCMICLLYLMIPMFCFQVPRESRRVVILSVLQGFFFLKRLLQMFTNITNELSCFYFSGFASIHLTI